MRKIILATIIILIIMQFLSCVWNRSRKYVRYDSAESMEISGWSFTPIIQSYHFHVDWGKPLDKDGVWLYLEAKHTMVAEQAEIYGVDIDSVKITCLDLTRDYSGVKYASAYGDILDDENIINMFRFRSPTGEDFISLPQDVDSILIEFDVIFYKGNYRTFQPSADSDLVRDTVAVNTASPETFRQRVKMKLIRRESRTLIPAFV
ncbi:MAG: hypothetical protein GY841_17685 [FCB group bacterium]|nr:hypothetical protein [FCB group bacterium]